MRLPQLAFGALLLGFPLLSRAQTTEVAPAPRLYVGLAAYHSNYQNLGSWRQGDAGFRVPVQLTVGYQLCPRLALELGVAYSGRTTTYAYETSYSTGGGPLTNYQYTRTATERTTSVSALARYALTRQPAHRLQVEALGGVTLMHRNLYARGSETNDLSGSPQTTPFANRGSFNDLLLTAGLGLRYRLSSRFALNFDLTTNRSLSNASYGFTGSSALGLRYRFGK